MGNLENDEIVIQTYVDPDTQVEYFIVNPDEPNMCAVPRFLPDGTLKTSGSCLQSNVRYTTDDFMNKIFYLKNDNAVGGFQPIGFISACDLSNPKQLKFGVTPIEYVIPQEGEENG